MFDLLFRTFNQLLIFACCFSVILLFLSLAGLLRLLPALIPYVRRALRWLFVLSFRLYRHVLAWLAPYVEAYLGFSVVAGFPRVVAAVLLSVILGVTFLLLAHWSITAWSVGLCVLHGLVVGVAWDELEESEGLRLGVKAE